jgi:hypothetical protein
MEVDRGQAREEKLGSWGVRLSIDRRTASCATEAHGSTHVVGRVVARFENPSPSRRNALYRSRASRFAAAALREMRSQPSSEGGAGGAGDIVVDHHDA